MELFHRQTSEGTDTTLLMTAF